MELGMGSFPYLASTSYCYSVFCNTRCNIEFLEIKGIKNKEGKNMNFIEAVKLLKDTTIKLKKRDSEHNTFILGSLGLIHLDGIRGKNYPDAWSIYAPSVNDILVEDWYVVKDEKLHTFEEAIAALKEGKIIHRLGEKIKYALSDTNSFLLLVKEDILANDWIIIGDK